MAARETVILTPAEMAGVTGGFWSGPLDGLEIFGICVPPKVMLPGHLAIAVAPDKWRNIPYNSHKQLSRMIEAGVAAIMVDRDWYETSGKTYGVPLLVVDDTRQALTAIAIASRDKSPARRIQITGTEGKTGTKYALNELISRQAPCYAAETSANITVPVLLSLGSLKASVRYTIIEISCPQANRCTERSRLIRPDIAIITNLNSSHLNTHGSIENLISHKLESLDGLKEDGIVLINRDTSLFEPFMEKLRREKPDVKYMLYGASEECDAFITRRKFVDFGWEISANIDGIELAYRINRVQEHIPLGSLPVLLTMKLLGLDVHQAARDFGGDLRSFDSMGALKKLAVNSGTLYFYDQHFSVTETALKSALRDVKRMQVKGRKIAVISGELNSAGYAGEVHKRIAGYVDDTDIDILFTVGEHMDITVQAMKNNRCFQGHFFNVELLIPRLLEILAPDDLLFIKGMTRLNFKAVSEAVQQRFPPIRGPAKTRSGSKTVDICFVGDTYFGEWHMERMRAEGQRDVLAERGYLGFGEKLNPLLHDCDLVVANLETAVTGCKKPSFAGEKGHVYNADRERTIAALKASNIRVVSLANNHAGDYGREGLVDTIEALREAGIQPIGAGWNEEEAAAPFIYAHPEIPEFRLAIVSTYNLNPRNREYGFYAGRDIPGVNLMDTGRLRQQARALKRKDPGLFLVLTPHWGANFIWRPDINRQRAQKITAAGFDLVIGHSAHMMQEVEYVNNKPVFYGIGNFILNGQGLEYRNKNLPPYSLIIRLRVTQDEKGLAREIFAYPFVCDNSATDYQPRFVTREEFDHVEMVLRSHCYNAADSDRLVRRGRDGFGYYLRYEAGKT